MVRVSIFCLAVATKLNLASSRHVSGDPTGALELLESVHATWDRQLPADHPNLLAAKQNLALMRRDLGDLAGAHELFVYVHAAHTRLLPADHPKSIFRLRAISG